MILVDANLLVYATVQEYEQHPAAREWFGSALSGPYRVGLPWPSMLAFHRIVTHPKVFERPLTPKQAWKHVESWLEVDDVWIPTPGKRHFETLSELIRTARVVGNLTYDAHLAALAITHGLELMSTDGDLARFDDLRWTNPLA